MTVSSYPARITTKERNVQSGERNRKRTEAGLNFRDAIADKRTNYIIFNYTHKL